MSSEHYNRGCITPTCHVTADVNLDNLVKVIFSRLLHCKVIVFPFHILFTRWVTKTSQHSSVEWGWEWGKLSSISCVGSIYIYYLEFLCKDNVFLLFYFFHLITYLCGPTYICMLLWISYPIIYYLFCFSNYYSFGHWELFPAGFCVPWSVLLLLEHFLTFWCHKLWLSLYVSRAGEP